jgi:hypothetical protein
MQIDSAVVSVLLGIKSHMRSPPSKVFSANTSIPNGMLKEGASMSITRLEKNL